MKNKEIKTIMVPTDFSDLSANAVRTAISICERQNALLILIHIVETIHFVPPPDANSFLIDYLPRITKNAKSNLNKIQDQIKMNHSINVRCITRKGNVSDLICKIAESQKADLIVMGSHGISGIREFFLGSNAYKVVKDSPCPVLTVYSQGEWQTFKKILFPVRITQGALEKYDFIRPIIRRNNAELTILGISSDNNEENLAQITFMVNKLEENLKEDGVSYQIRYNSSVNIAESVLTYAKENMVDLIVITASLDNTIRNFFIGKYSQQIINHSKVPVLSIKPEPKAIHDESFSDIGIDPTFFKLLKFGY